MPSARVVAASYGEFLEKLNWTKDMRLHRPDEYRRVWNNGRSWAHPFFILWVLPNQTEVTRVGLTASKKVGNAVMRNRARRVMREAIRLQYHDIQSGLDIVLVARKSILNQQSGAVQQALTQMLDRNHLLITDRGE